MNEDGAVCLKEGGSLFQATSGIEQQAAFVGDVQVEREGMVLQVGDNLSGKMVHIDHHARGPGFLQALEHMPEERFSRHLDQCLGHTVGERFEPGAQSSRENHCLHGSRSIVGNHVCKVTYFFSKTGGLHGVIHRRFASG